jgi:fatty acid desaturase
VRPNSLTVARGALPDRRRQLGLAVLMHEAAHGTLLRRRRWNDLGGTWLCAYPVWSDICIYRPYHLKHHATTWTAEDPDLGLASPFPCTRRELQPEGLARPERKHRREALRTILRYHRIGRDFDAGARVMGGVLLTNGLLLACSRLAGHPALYLLWVGAWLTTYSLAMRIRSIAEHGDDPDPSRRLPQHRARRSRAGGSVS